MVESKLDARLCDVESNSTQLKETMLMDKNEFQGLIERMESLTAQLESEKKYSKSLSEELKQLRKSLESYETSLNAIKERLVSSNEVSGTTSPKSPKVMPAKNGSTTTVVFVLALALCVGLGSAYLLSPDGMESLLKFFVFN